MSDDFSRKGLLGFLDYLGSKGLMNPATVASRKAAVNTFLSILSDEEAKDLRKIDLDQIEARFFNLKGTQFKPESVRVYKSRVSSAIGDLKSYRANPSAFKPSFSAPKASTAKSEKEAPSKNSGKLADFSEETSFSFPIPIRPDLTVRLIGVPSDLTKQEATKIANVVLALAAT